DKPDAGGSARALASVAAGGPGSLRGAARKHQRHRAGPSKHGVSMSDSSITVRAAREEEVPLVVQFIRELAEYEHLLHEVVATEERLRTDLFGARPYAEVVFACLDAEPVGFALFFHNYSTFLGRPGIYLEDLFVREAARGRGAGQALLQWLAAQ